MEETPDNQTASAGPGDEGRRNSPVGENRDAPRLRRLVNVLFTRQSVQRPALARETNLSLQVVADLLAELERRGLVLVNGRFTGMPGRSNLTYALAAGAAAALAIRVSDHRIETTLCDLRGSTLASQATPLQTNGLADQIGAAVRRVCEKAGLERYRLGVAHVTLEPGASAHAPEIRAELLVTCGCPTRVDFDTERPLSDQLEAARDDLLDLVFGEP